MRRPVPASWTGSPRSTTPLGGGEAVIPDALMYYRRGPADGDDGAMLRAFVEVDRATMGPERLAAKIGAYARLHRYPHTRRPPPVLLHAGPGGGGMAATLSALPPGLVRPGRHWPRRHHHPHPRPPCSCK
ncbi:replication-relaxation family protein [Streptomyces umbrinus]|uniref:replication-relaxation family protein n=1 Tax=Streptomyces umbrinus TaxID=67370 RepID=UPI003424DADA